MNLTATQNVTALSLTATYAGNAVTVRPIINQVTSAFSQITGLTLSVGGWALDVTTYKYQLANANILSTSIVDVIPDNDDISIVIAAEVLPQTVSEAGLVNIWATNIPSGDIGVTINIFN